LFQSTNFAAIVRQKLTTPPDRLPFKNAPPPPEPPSPEVLSGLFDIMFFASIKTEEGLPIRVRVFYVDPENVDPEAPPYIRVDRWKIFPLVSRIPLTVANLVKLARAADPWSTGLAIFHTAEGLIYVWGMVDQVVHMSMAMVHEASPSYGPPGIFNAVINGPADLTVFREDSFIARWAQDLILASQNDCLWQGRVSKIIQRWLAPLWGQAFQRIDPRDLAGQRRQSKYVAKEVWTRTLCRILINIQRQRHGGALLLTPTQTADLVIKYGLDYRRVSEAHDIILEHTIRLQRVREAYDAIHEDPPSVDQLHLLNTDRQLTWELEDAERSLTGAIRFISSMANVDGLILASPDFAIKGFGTEITTKHDISELTIASSADMREIRKMDASSFGTRHRSMARYCSANPGSLGFVLSQDGDIRAITKIGARSVIFENVKVQYLWGDDLWKMIEATYPN
jgi:hypothetical protein